MVTKPLGRVCGPTLSFGCFLAYVIDRFTSGATPADCTQVCYGIDISSIFTWKLFAGANVLQ